MFRKFYSLIRKFLGKKFNSKLTKFVFAISRKPFAKKNLTRSKKLFPNGESGGLIISVDFELAWAFRYSKKYSDPLLVASQLSQKTRLNFATLLFLAEENKIPYSWATVGHLFLESCKPGDHNWMNRIPYFNDHWKYIKGDWFEHDPSTSYQENENWYAPDLIKLILASNINHELGCHTFSHIDFSDKNCPSLVAEDEIVACINAMAPYGIRPKSMVFPGGTYGNIAVLKKYGFNIYRRNVEYDIAYPYRDKFGLLVSPTSACFDKTYDDWTPNYTLKRFKKYIDKAILTNTISHFWFHPSIDQWTINNLFPELFYFFDQQRQKGNLWIGTMGEISDYINKNQVV
jgi:hypothetical protein